MICKGLVLREQYTIKPLCVGSWGPVQGILGGLSPYLSGKQRRGLVHQQNPRLEICSGGSWKDTESMCGAVGPMQGLLPSSSGLIFPFAK